MKSCGRGYCGAGGDIEIICLTVGPFGCEWVGCSNTLEDNVKQLRSAFGEEECDFMQVVGGWERW